MARCGQVDCRSLARLWVPIPQNRVVRRQFNRTNVERPCGGALLYSTRRGRAFPESDLGRWVSFRMATTRPLRNQHEELSSEFSDEMDKTARQGAGPLVSPVVAPVACAPALRYD